MRLARFVQQLHQPLHLARIQMPKAQKGKLGASLVGTLGAGIAKVWTELFAASKAILAYRASHGRFRSVTELLEVPGIGPAKLEALRPLVKV